MTTLHAVLVTFFVSMVPVLELRGAIPLGVAQGLSPLAALAIAVAGNLLPIPFLVVFTRRVFAWLARIPRVGPLVHRLESRARRKGALVQKYARLGLCILVAIPLPGTGAWTGALAAAFLDIRLRDAMPPIALGVVIAGFIMTGVSYGFLHLLG